MMSQLAGEKIRDQAVLHWVADSGDETLSLDHLNLNSRSLVIDFGGYTGVWAEKIFSRYDCFIEIYEPAHEFVLEIEHRFRNHLNSKILVRECALGSVETHADLVMDGLATSIKKGNGTGTVFVASASKILSDRKIDLLKMNIEGSEYEVFDSLFENDLVKNISSIFVQFHPIDDESIDKYNKIADQLSSTHDCVFRYPFIWEKWNRKV